jgi:uncharacterized protein YtpQ (UPF0354 family)
LFSDARIEQGESIDHFQISLSSKEPNAVYLENIWRNCQHDAESRVPQVERFLRALLTAFEKSDELPHLSSIVPIVKDEEYLNVGRKEGKEIAFAHEHLVADLWIVYAIDTADAMKTLSIESLSKLDLQREDLKTMAVENLKHILPAIEQHGNGPVYMLTAGADYVASLLLFDDLWDRLASTVDGDIVAAAPTRDVVLFTGSKCSSGIVEMRKSIARLTETGSYVVSSSMLRRHTGGWKIFS